MSAEVTSYTLYFLKLSNALHGQFVQYCISTRIAINWKCTTSLCAITMLFSNFRIASASLSSPCYGYIILLYAEQIRVGGVLVPQYISIKGR